MLGEEYNMREGRVVIDPNILAGKPIIKGTRMAVEFILELLANGWTNDQILQNYPQLTKQDILAALSYAASLLKEERIYYLPQER
jgi:uncharacterized protein (DUF433 family)